MHQDHVAEAADVPKKPPKEASGPHHRAVRAFCGRWKTRYGETYPFAEGKDGSNVAWMIKHEPDRTGGDVRRHWTIDSVPN